MSNTSIGRGPASGGNENHDGDPTHKTLGEAVKQELPAGSVAPDAAPAAPAIPSDRNQPRPDAAVTPPN